MKPIKRILVPTDGSECAKLAANYAFEMSKKLDATIDCLFVFDYNSFTSIENKNLEEYIRETCDKMVGEIIEMGKAQGVDVVPLSESGNPADAITKLSADYDLVIMGTVGRTGLTRAIIGSVAEKTVRMAKCPVLVVKKE